MKEYELKMYKYKKYKPISKLIANIQQNREIVKFHYDKQKKIVETKGLEIEEQKLLTKT